MTELQMIGVASDCIYLLSSILTMMLILIKSDEDIVASITIVTRILARQDGYMFAAMADRWRIECCESVLDKKLYEKETVDLKQIRYCSKYKNRNCSYSSVIPLSSVSRGKTIEIAWTSNHWKSYHWKGRGRLCALPEVGDVFSEKTPTPILGTETIG
nr:probable 1-deoxy-D-xylulose-5-phosphate synthase, chloroplastic isoform X1 [Tanacetum cinerariifolium]